jgi:hypothetical protein
MIDQKILSKIYLGAVLPTMEALSIEDPEASSYAAQWNGRIRIAVGFTGPRCDIAFKDSRVEVESGGRGRSNVYLFFPTTKMLNALFTGKGLSIPIPLKGFTRLKGLKVFSLLAKRMEKVLDGGAAPEKIMARITMDIMVRTLAIIAGDDPELHPLAQKLHGKMEFRIKNGHAAYVDFTGGRPKSIVGTLERPDCLFEFATDDIFLKVAEDKVDVLAEASLLNISLKGDLHMAQVVNIFLDKIGAYLPQKEVAK